MAVSARGIGVRPSQYSSRWFVFRVLHCMESRRTSAPFQISVHRVATRASSVHPEQRHRELLAGVERILARVGQAQLRRSSLPPVLEVPPQRDRDEREHDGGDERLHERLDR